MKMRPVLALLGAAAALVLAGSTAAATVSVIITNKGYNPRNLTIAPGDTVTFANNDTVQHQVVFTCGQHAGQVRPDVGRRVADDRHPTRHGYSR